MPTHHIAAYRQILSHPPIYLNFWQSSSCLLSVEWVGTFIFIWLWPSQLLCSFIVIFDSLFVILDSSFIVAFLTITMISLVLPCFTKPNFLSCWLWIRAGNFWVSIIRQWFFPVLTVTKVIRFAASFVIVKHWDGKQHCHPRVFPVSLFDLLVNL